MNAVTVIEAAETTASFESWVAEGKGIAARISGATWELGDWGARGEAEGWCTPEQIEMLGGELGIAPKRIKQVMRTAKTFPPALRDTSLTIDHHIAVNSLKQEEAFELLGAAKQNRWAPDRLKEVVAVGDAAGRLTLIDHDAMLESFIHHWNRLPRAVRLAAAERIIDADGDELEP